MFLVMEIKFLKDEKDSMEVQIDSLTLVEILRVYLNKDSAVSFVAWKQKHPTENPILAVKTSGKSAKKAVADAVSAITKDLDGVSSDFKKI